MEAHNPPWSTIQARFEHFENRGDFVQVVSHNERIPCPHATKGLYWDCPGVCRGYGTGGIAYVHDGRRVGLVMAQKWGHFEMIELCEIVCKFSV